MRAHRMNGWRWMFLAAIASLSWSAPAPAADKSSQPNIIYVLADDLGWQDVSFHGGEIKTPNVDRLANEGVRLERFYVQSVCTPTRAALMTGRYPMRFGLQVGVVRPWAQYGLPLDQKTLPQKLSTVGYDTYITGKWHLGHFRPEYLPTRRGFKHQYGHYNGAIDYNTHVRDGGLDWHRDDKALKEEGYSTRLLASEAARIIQSHDAAKPLFLYVPFNAVHSPHQAPERYTKAYANLPEPRRTYAGMVAAMDEGIGEILKALDESKLRDNTLVIFHSDNGGPAPGKVTSNGELRAGKATLYEGGVRVPSLAYWPGKLEAGRTVTAPLHVSDWHATLLALAGYDETDKTLDGQNAWAAISTGADSPRKEILLNSTPRSGAILIEPWKLVINGEQEHNDGRDAQTGKLVGLDGEDDKESAEVKLELFNLQDDPNEKTNLAAQLPDKVKELRTRYDELAAQAVPPQVAPKAPDFVSPAVWGESPVASITPDLKQISDAQSWKVLHATSSVDAEGNQTSLRLAAEGEAGGANSNVGLALAEGIDFKNGTIEVELKGRDVRQGSFLGVAFHAADAKTFEAVYFRPFNFRADPPFKTRAVQYISWPEHTWEKLREQSPGVYENAVQSIPDPNDWFRARIEVDGKTVRAFVNDATEPSLVVKRITDRTEGGVGLWVDFHEGQFRNLKITPSSE